MINTDPCVTPGCPGDGRYSAPGRGHDEGCRHPVPPTDHGVAAAAEAVAAIYGYTAETYPVRGERAFWRTVRAAVAAARPIIEAEVRRSLLWECPDCAFGFDRMHTDEDGGYSCPLCELAVVRERIAVEERAVKHYRVGPARCACGYDAYKVGGFFPDYHAMFMAHLDDAARIARGTS